MLCSHCALHGVRINGAGAVNSKLRLHKSVSSLKKRDTPYAAEEGPEPNRASSPSFLLLVILHKEGLHMLLLSRSSWSRPGCVAARLEVSNRRFGGVLRRFMVHFPSAFSLFIDLDEFCIGKCLANPNSPRTTPNCQIGSDQDQGNAWPLKGKRLS